MESVEASIILFMIFGGLLMFTAGAVCLLATYKKLAYILWVGGIVYVLYMVSLIAEWNTTSVR